MDFEAAQTVAALCFVAFLILASIALTEPSE